MQAVILAAGKSTRTYPLTLTRPKPLLPLANKPLLAHTLERLKGIITEAILIVGYKKEMIRKYFGKGYNGIKIRYVWQKEQLGTGHALLLANPFIKGRFIAMAGDDLYGRKDILACMKHKNAILIAKHSHPQNFGVVRERGGKLIDIIEKPKEFISSQINTSFYVLEPKIFGILSKLKKSARGEYELTDALGQLARDAEVRCVRAKRHIAIGYPWDVLKADASLRNGKSAVGKGCAIDGTVINSSIGDGCIIKGTVKNSIVMGNTFITTNSVIENSIIGSHVHFDGIITSKKKATSIVRNKPQSAGEFGAAVGDNVIAKKAAIASGCKIWPGKAITGTIASDIT